MTRNNFFIITILLTCVSITSYSQSIRKLVGLYGKCKKEYYSCVQMELKNDQTFEYYIFIDIGGGSILEGSWKVDNDTLILNTFNQPDSIELVLLDLPMPVPDYLTNEKWVIKGNKLFPYIRHSAEYDKKYFLRKTLKSNKKF